MIDFRYHLVSLIAVFLAVALGIVIGTTQLNGPVLTNLQDQVSALQTDKRLLEDETQSLQTQLDSQGGFAEEVGPALVAGTLAGRRVLLVVADEGVEADIVARWPGLLVEYYGMAEGGASCALNCTAHPTKLHTVGPPMPGHEIRLIDEQGQEVAPGETGEVVGRSPTMMTGYHGRDAATRDAEWYDAEGTRFIRHGDIGRFDEVTLKHPGAML